MTETGSTTGGSAAGPRLGAMHGDRPCIRCGFNLHGQPLVREGHYGLIIARCPECGEVAALQEYPSLGRWAGRFAGVGAAAWLLLMVLLGVGTSRILYERIEQSGIDVLHPAGLRLATAYREFARRDLEKRYPDPAQRQQWTQWWESNTVENYPIVGQEFMQDPSYAELLGSLRLGENIDIRRARTIGWLGFAGVVLGAVWAVLVPHARWKGRLLIATLLSLCVAAWWGWTLSGAGSPTYVWGGGQEWGPALAFKALGGPLVPLGLAGGWIALMVGLMIGRPVARWLIVVLLPPRLRAPLGALWSLHGLSVPGGHGPRRARADSP